MLACPNLEHPEPLDDRRPLFAALALFVAAFAAKVALALGVSL